LADEIGIQKRCQFDLTVYNVAVKQEMQHFGELFSLLRKSK